jgi:hypothetical protein
MEKTVALKPKFVLDENWEIPKRTFKVDSPKNVLWHSLTKAYSTNEIKTEPVIEIDNETIKELINEVRIEVAEAANTRALISNDIKDTNNDYLASQIGMNIVLPRGRIKRMRFKAELIADGEVFAIDGFPKDQIDEKYIVSGTIKLGISNLFELIPAVGPWVSALKVLDINLNPWDFKIGRLKRVNVDFSGGLTSRPEWFFKKNGIKNDLNVIMTIKKPKEVKRIDARVEAKWELKHPEVPRDLRFQSDEETIRIFPI